MKTTSLFIAAALVFIGSFIQGVAAGGPSTLVEFLDGFEALDLLVDSVPGLLDTLNGSDAPKVIFAPTNAAFGFEDDPPDEVGDIDLPEGAVLADVLNFHTVAEEFDPAGTTFVNTGLQNGDFNLLLKVVTNGGGTTVQFGGANDVVSVEQTLVVENGENVEITIHIIDGILLPPGSLIETASGTSVLSGLVSVITGSAPDGFDTTVNSLQGVTLFAPVNDAFEEVSALLPFLSEDYVAKVLLNHVVETAIDSNEATAEANEEGGAALTTETDEGYTVTIIADNGNLKYGNAVIIGTDVLTNQGVVHLIDKVVFPTLAQELAGSELLELAISANIVETLQGENTPAVIFAPSDDAFDGLDPAPSGQELVDTLLFHTVADLFIPDENKFVESGYVNENPDGSANYQLRLKLTVDSGVSVRGNGVTDIPVTGTRVVRNEEGINIVLHDIESVLTIPGSLIETADDTLVLSELVSVITDSAPDGFDTTVNSLRGVTLFAPDNDAFGEISAVLETLTEDEVQNVLLNHVVAAIVSSLDATSAVGGSVTSLAGVELAVTDDDDGLQIAGASIEATDILTNQGIVHIIGSVMVPPEPTPSPTATGETASPTSSAFSAVSVYAVVVASIAMIFSHGILL